MPDDARLIEPDTNAGKRLVHRRYPGGRAPSTFGDSYDSLIADVRAVEAESRERIRAVGVTTLRRMLYRGQLIRALHERLLAIGEHSNNCRSTLVGPPDPDCTCGLSDLLNEAALLPSTLADEAAIAGALRGPL